MTCWRSARRRRGMRRRGASLTSVLPFRVSRGSSPSGRIQDARCDRRTRHAEPAHRPPVPVAALVDDKLMRGVTGYRAAGMPREPEAWQRGLRASTPRPGRCTALLPCARSRRQDALLQRVEAGDVHHEAWGRMPPAHVLQTAPAARHRARLLVASHGLERDWLGWAGKPAWLCGMGYDRRDPWEAVEARLR